MSGGDTVQPASPLLRPYQDVAVADFERGVAAGHRRQVLVAPTGSGKTVVFCAIIKRQHRSVLVISHRREIIAQTSKKLSANGVRHGIIQAGIDPRPMERVQVASIQTLWVRGVRSKAMPLPPADLLVIDEAHHCPATTYRKIIDAYPDAVLLGATATPCRGDGRGLGGIFERIIECPQVPELINQGYLVKTRIYAPVDPDLRGVRVQARDYSETQLADRMDRPKLIGDIVTHWHKYGERQRTIAFACSVAHSIHIRDEFVRVGVRAEHIDGCTPKAERDAALARLVSGETELITNCMVLTEGWDMPEVGCAILARPTRRMGLFRQMIGRVLRPADGKAYAIVLDHSGSVFRHGLPEDHVNWTLDPDRCAESPAHQARLAKKVAGLIECSQCSALRLGGQPCPVCAFLPRRPAEYIRIQDGDLALVEGGRAKAQSYNAATRARWHAMLTAIGIARGYKRGWIAHKYKEKFGVFPPWGSPPDPIEPSLEVRSWVRSREIAWAKSKLRKRAAS
jgi:DNA repair protein RadD